MATADGDYLRRLPAEYYRGRAMVHWSMSVAGRSTGWLGPAAHACWREMLLHVAHRYRLAAPVYCLMPDHAHVLLVGLQSDSDQRKALSFLRRYSAPMLGLGQWQRQAHDHVLRHGERSTGAFQTIAHYIRENPVRAGHVANASAWPYSGTVMAGWPDLDWRQEDFWARWWRLYSESGYDVSPTRRGTTPPP